MSEKKFTLVFLLALLIGGAATYGVYEFINAQKLAAAQLGRVETAPVVVTKKEIAEGSGLDDGDLELQWFPASAVPEGSFADVEGLVERVARSRLYKGEPVLEEKLAPLGAQPGIEVRIAPGYRAMAIRISDVVGLTGLVRPDSRVDVLATFAAGKTGRSQPISKIILQDMRVLSVGTETERGDPSKPIISSAVTLEVLPEEAEILAVAMNEGTLSLALRSFGDPGSKKTPGATTAKVLAGVPIPKPKPTPRPARRPPPRPKPASPPVFMPPDTTRTVEIYRGTRRSEEEVAKDSAETNR